MYDDFDQDFDEQPNGDKQSFQQKSKKHKGKANGFLMFMLEFRRNEASKGNHLDMEESQYLAGELWGNMSMDEREKYSNKPSSKDSSSSRQHTAPTRYTSFGVSFDTIDRQKYEEKERIRRIETTVEEMLQIALEQNTLKTKTFYFFSASHFVETLQSDVFPAEIAISKFSLASGVTDTLHMLVNPGDLPLGMYSAALEHAKNYHKRQLPPKIEGETDYSVMLNKILNFLGIDNLSIKGLPVLFVEPGLKGEDYKTAKLTLDKLVKENGLQIEFRLYPIEYLLFKLHKKCIQETDKVPFINVMHAKEMMNRDKFMYSNIGCEFHQVEDCNLHCCLAKVIRWGYTISMFCLNDTDEQIPGRHFPEFEVIVNENDEDASVIDSQWDSELTHSYSQIQINSERTYHSRSSLLPSAPVTPIHSGISVVSTKESIGSHQEEQIYPLDSTISISEMIKRAAVPGSSRGRNRRH